VKRVLEGLRLEVSNVFLPKDFADPDVQKPQRVADSHHGRDAEDYVFDREGDPEEFVRPNEREHNTVGVGSRVRRLLGEFDYREDETETDSFERSRRDSDDNYQSRIDRFERSDFLDCAELLPPGEVGLTHEGSLR